MKTSIYLSIFLSFCLSVSLNAQGSEKFRKPQACPGVPSVRDIDGNTYNTVQIGAQCWTKENLKVTKYNNGKPIPTGLNSTNWKTTTSGAYVIYGNKNANDALYGKLYNWYAVADSKGLCPKGWHVPSDSEWTTLTTYLGGDSVAGGKMKSTGTTYWNSPNTGATNASGFSALPGGSRNGVGSFNNVRSLAEFWSATENDNSSAEYRGLGYVDGELFKFGSMLKQCGISVRCLRD